MKKQNNLNWTKKDAQNYGAFMALFGFLLGLLTYYVIFK